MKQGITAAVARVLSFAHLAGLGTAVASDGGVAPKDEGPQAPGASEGGVAPKDEGPQAPGASAEGDEDRKRREGESDDEYAKRMKRMDDEASASDESDKDEKEKAAHAAGYAAGYAASRDRCAAIFALPAAARNIALAAELAFGSDLAVDRVAAVLEKSPPPANAQRSARNPQVGVSGGAPQPPAVAAASRWDANLKEALGRNKRA